MPGGRHGVYHHLAAADKLHPVAEVVVVLGRCPHHHHSHQGCRLGIIITQDQLARAPVRGVGAAAAEAEADQG